MFRSNAIPQHRALVVRPLYVDFDIFAQKLISYVQMLLNKFVRNISFDWYHQVNLEKFSKKP